MELSKNQKFIMERFFTQKSPEVLIRNKEIKAIEKRFIKLRRRDGKRTSLASFQTELIGIPSALAEMQRSIDFDQALQGAVLSECVYSQTIANQLGLVNWQNLRTTDCYLDSRVEKRLGELGMTGRYSYISEDSNLVLVQAGGHNASDAVLFDLANGLEAVIEFKEIHARVRETDLLGSIKDDFLVEDATFLQFFPEWRLMIKEQVAENLYMNEKGNKDNFSQQALEHAINTIFGEPTAPDVIFIEDRFGKLALLPSNFARIWADLEGEIRRVGKNAYKADEDYVEKVVIGKGGMVMDGIAKIARGSMIRVPARGKAGELSKFWNLDHALRIEDRFTGNDTDFATFPISRVKIKRPTIAAKFNFKKRLDAESSRTLLKEWL